MDAPMAPLTGSRLALGAVALSLATFMNVLDTSIANVSIPAIAGDLGVSPDQGTWVITSFGVANAAFLPLTGWLTRRFGQVRVFSASILLFTLTSFLCGLAPTLSTLIVFRVLQGAVAGPMIPLSQALLLASYPRHRSGSALALWGTTTIVAPVIGPVLGGWITDNISWPWIFYINVPIGALAAAVTLWIYRRRETPTTRAPLDAIGVALLVLWVGALQVALDQGKDLDWFNSTEIITLAIVAGVGLAVFVVWELTERDPVVDLRLFARRSFWTATVALSLGYGTYFGSVVLLPLWLQQDMGYTATLAGVVLAPVGILALVTTPVVGRTLHRVDPRLFATAAFGIFALVMFMRSRFSTDAGVAVLLIPTLVQGIAVSMFFIPLINLGLSGLGPARIPGASGLINFVRITAGSFGTSIATTMWDRRATFHHARLGEHLSQYTAASTQWLSTLGDSGLSAAQSYGALNRILDQQAYTLSADDIFYASGVIFVALIPVIWLAGRPKTAAPADAPTAAH